MINYVIQNILELAKASPKSTRVSLDEQSSAAQAQVSQAHAIDQSSTHTVTQSNTVSGKYKHILNDYGSSYAIERSSLYLQVIRNSSEFLRLTKVRYLVTSVACPAASPYTYSHICIRVTRLLSCHICPMMHFLRFHILTKIGNSFSGL